MNPQGTALVISCLGATQTFPYCSVNKAAVSNGLFYLAVSWADGY